LQRDRALQSASAARLPFPVAVAVPRAMRMLNQNK
jgi:hypothetical protein